MTRFKSPPFVILAFSLLAYAPLLAFTGFYWDDWGFAWTARFLGPMEFIESFRPFRPFLGPIFVLTTSLLPSNPLVWQVFGFFIRFASGLAAWWMVKTIWPGLKRQALTLSLLFLLFPAYTQQWSAFTHTNQELIPLIFYLLSFGLTARALQSKAFWPNTLAALLSGALGLVTTEYFIGFEIFRLGIIWYLQQGLPPQKRIGQTLRHFIPYLLLWLGNAAWLAYYYTYGPYNSYGVSVLDGLRAEPAAFIAATAADMGRTLLIAGLQAWSQTLRIFAQSPLQPLSWLIWGLSIAALMLTVFCRAEMSGGENRRWALWAVIFGILGIFAGRLPSWAAGLPLKLTFSWDRFFLSMMLGSSLLLAGLLELLPLGRRRWLVLSLVLALAVGQQNLHANAYRRDWVRQRDLYWQMVWRMPALEPGTALLTHEFPNFDYDTDLTFTFPVNWIYAPDYDGGNLPYVLLYSAVRLGGPNLPALEADLPLKIGLRTVTFHGSTSDLVVLYFPERGCLRVLDPAYDGPETLPRVHPDLLTALPLSDLSRIHNGNRPAVPERAVFGPEPEHDWCYYYARAEFARQTGNWSEVASLGQAAIDLGLEARDVYEWLPFIEAFARTGDWETARQISSQTLSASAQTRKGICAIWQRVPDGRAHVPPELNCP
jgi:hypothetical protein